jgi:polyisoprenoid-binding protein YceI
LVALIWISLAASAGAQELSLQCDLAHTTANFTLGDVLHTVHGSFQAKGGEIHFDPASNKISGEIVFDATSGHTGNSSRDHKMHKDVLQSERYPEISFRPDHAGGTIAIPGSATLQVHGFIGMHGGDHEISVPVTVNLAADHWEASAHFQVPYVQWGMKNPSVLLLRVGDTVDIDLHAEGPLVRAASQ